MAIRFRYFHGLDEVLAHFEYRRSQYRCVFEQELHALPLFILFWLMKEELIVAAVSRSVACLVHFLLHNEQFVTFCNRES